MDRNGDLVLSLADGQVRHHKPVLYQTVNGVRQEVAGSFVLRGKQVSFAVDDYDRTKELVIDPTLNYSTYLGGNGRDEALGIAVNSSNEAVVTGSTYGAYADYDTYTATTTGFPITDSAYQSTSGSAGDVFVTRVNSSGNGLQYSTFLGQWH